MKNINDCTKCPYFGSDYDSFIGDGDMWCDCGIEDIECNYPLWVRHIKAFISRKRQEKWEKQAEKSYLKDEEKRAYAYYNLSEDIYLLLQESAEEIENLYGKETDLTTRLRSMIDKLEQL